ncbi:MAG: hypothetical protein ACLFTT_12075 [Candidatus Hydrogenedentota bacterium]
MNSLTCPHCNSHRIVAAKVPNDVVVVTPCPECGELAVLFRDKAIALDRKVIEEGSSEERIKHLAHVINAFLESGILPIDSTHEETPEPTRKPRRAKRRRPRRPRAEFEEVSDAEGEGETEDSRRISDNEFDRFVKHELHRIDDPGYFRRHFG